MYKSKPADIPLDEQEIGFNDFIRNLKVQKLSNEEQTFLEDDLTLEAKKMSFLLSKKIKLPVKMVFAKSFMKLSFIFQNRIQLTCIMKLFREVASNADKNNDANFFRKIWKMKT